MLFFNFRVKMPHVLPVYPQRNEELIQQQHSVFLAAHSAFVGAASSRDYMSQQDAASTEAKVTSVGVGLIGFP